MLELKNIRKSFGKNIILKNVSLSINNGEIVSILGPSGSGKTTLLNLILGITDIENGNLILDGKDITKVPMEKRGFNIVFQDYALFPNLNAYENITYGLRNKPNISSKEEVDDLIKLLGLEEHLNKNINQLSGGQKQRVALARTMVMKPKILLLDEPLSALDGVIKESIKEKIKTIAKDFNLTTIIVTHDPEEALTLSDKVLIIDHGEISQFGKPEEIIHAPKNDFVKKFILNQLEIKKNNIFSLFNSSEVVFRWLIMSKQKNRQLRIIFIFVIAIFGIFLLLPTITLLLKSFITDNGISFESYMEMLGQKRFYKAFGNSLVVALFSGVLSTFLAFIMAYTINFTNLCKGIKSTIKTLGVLPMLLPTITYGFAIIYSFGKQGLITKLFGKQIFDIYGFKGLVLGYVIYTLPIAFILINNTMLYIDKSFITVSRIMGDSKIRTLWIAVISPLLGTLAAAVIQCFFLSFTDFGIPASIGGEYEVVATLLFNEMLGSVPNFNNGAVIALSMLLPSILSISLLTYLEKYNIRYNKISQPEIKKNKVRDFVCGGLSIVIILIMLSIFAVIVVVPFAEELPYRIVFSMKNLNNVFSDSSLIGVFTNSILVSVLTALFGTLIAYCGALISSRSKLKFKGTIEKIALITNTIPGMVLGIAFLLVFTGTPIQNTFFIIIICNIVHFFSTPYLMLKGTLEKMNSSWETTAMLMGDSWIKTIIRIVTPNAMPTILQVFEYYFVNAMVTVSAIIFLVGARTSVITTKIKELQHISKFNEIFVLSLLLLLTNIAIKIFIKLYINYKRRKLKWKN